MNTGMSMVSDNLRVVLATPFAASGFPDAMLLEMNLVAAEGNDAYKQCLDERKHCEQADLLLAQYTGE